jgi:hypothetical protein
VASRTNIRVSDELWTEGKMLSYVQAWWPRELVSVRLISLEENESSARYYCILDDIGSTRCRHIRKSGVKVGCLAMRKPDRFVRS